MGAMLAFLAGCCPTFEETRVTDPDGVATGGMVDAVQGALDQFAAWTGREGVCVSEMRIVPDDEPDLDGYDGRFIPTGLILLSVEAAEWTPRHELCHALDEVEGISAAHEDAFRTHVFDDPDSYADSPEENFAHVCAEEPDDLAFARAFAPLCDRDDDAERAGIVLDEVLREADAESGIVGTVPVDVTRNLAFANEDYEGVLLGAVDGSGVAVLLANGVASLLRISAEGQVETNELPVFGGAEAGRLVTGEGEAFLLQLAPEEAAWRLDVEAGTVAEVAIPPGAAAATYFSGTVAGGAIWWLDAGAPGGQLRTWNPETGEEGTVPWPDDPPAWLWGGITQYSVGLASEGDRVVVATARGLLLYDRLDGTWQAAEAPAETLAMFRVSGAGDGKWVSLSPVVPGLEGNASSLSTLLVYDEATGGWLVPEEPCGASEFRGIAGLVADGANARMWDYGIDGTYDNRYFAKLAPRP